MCPKCPEGGWAAGAPSPRKVGPCDAATLHHDNRFSPLPCDLATGLQGFREAVGAGVHAGLAIVSKSRQGHIISLLPKSYSRRMSGNSASGIALIG
jgi:hypothetical protein